jgi:hypothetical protein
VVVGSEWSKVRGFLQSEESFTFLDRLDSELGQLAVAAELRAALVPLWWLRRRRRGSDPGRGPGLSPGGSPGASGLCQRIDPDWRESYRRVAAVLGRAVRASSAVVCNEQRVADASVAAPDADAGGGLDLKRLY